MNIPSQILRRIKSIIKRYVLLNKFRLWALSKSQRLNLIIGAGSVRQKGWIATDISLLDIMDPKDWSSLFYPESINKILSEHVLEHFAEDEITRILYHCYKYLSPTGVLRIAVPDGYRRDSCYQVEILPPKDGHKYLFNINNMTRLLSEIGFKVDALEYFDEEGLFHKKIWSNEKGIVIRSSKYDKQQRFKYGNLFYTSIIVDAYK